MAEKYERHDIDNESDRELLERYLVPYRDEKPKMIPYEDDYGKHSPLTDFMYYHKLPEVYRTFDEPLGKPLYRYLQSLLEGGYASLINSNELKLYGIDNLLDLVDPEKCPSQFLQYYCESMGIKWFPDLISKPKGDDRDEYYYIRTFLCNIGDIYKRRGTESVVRYITKTLAEMPVDIEYERVFNEDRTTRARILWVYLLAESQKQIENLNMSAKVIKRFIDTQIPYYITSAVVFVISYIDKVGRYNANFIVSNTHKVIRSADKVNPNRAIKAGRNSAISQSTFIEKTIRPKV